MIVGYAIRGKNRLFRYHLCQAIALFVFINVTALFVVSFMQLIGNGAATRGLALTYLFTLLLLRLDGTSNAWHGRLRPLPVFGNSLGQLVMVFLQGAEPVIQKAWSKMRAAADDLP